MPSLSEANVKHGLACVVPDFLLGGSLFFFFFFVPLRLGRAVVPSGSKATECEVLQVQLSELRKPAVLLDQWLRHSTPDHQFAGSIPVSYWGLMSTSAHTTFSARGRPPGWSEAVQGP